MRVPVASGSSGARVPRKLSLVALDPTAVSVTLASQRTMDAIGTKALWTLKLALVLLVVLAVSLFSMARGDPLAMQLVACISLLSVLFYWVRCQPSACHTDHVFVTGALAWVVYSCTVSMSHHTLDAKDTAHADMWTALRDTAVVLVVLLYSLRYWLLLRTPRSQGDGFVHELHTMLVQYVPPVLCFGTQACGQYLNYWRITDTTMSCSGNARMVESDDVSDVDSGGGGGGGGGGGINNSSNNGGGGGSGGGRAVRTRTGMQVFGATILAVGFDMLYWGMIPLLATPVLSSSMFQVPWWVTTLRGLCATVIYMLSDALMQPRHTAQHHAAPTLLCLTIYVWFITPWALFVVIGHVGLLVLYVLLRARWMQRLWPFKGPHTTTQWSLLLAGDEPLLLVSSANADDSTSSAGGTGSLLSDEHASTF